MEQIKCQNLSLGYEGREIIHDLNFSVNKGDYLCIVGENGSGKTTLMKAILGLHTPMSGSLSIQTDIKKTQIGYLPQQTLVQKDFPASVREIVLSGCQNRNGFRPFYNKSDKAVAFNNMKKMGIEDLADKCYRELSGGQQQRVLLARALCATQKMLLLDEPVAGLDPKVTEEMYSLIYKLNQDDKITIIMITHDTSASVKYSSHILHIGNKLFFGTRSQYLQSEFAKEYLKKEMNSID